MRTRLAFGVLVITFLVLAVGGTAGACEGVGGSVSPSSAGPGDPITYSFSGLLPGAAYRATLDGQTMDSGVNGSSAGGSTGSFSMPDLGDQPQTVYVTLYAEHSEDNFEWDRSFPVQYLPPVSSATTSQTSAAPSAVARVRKDHRVQRPTAIAKHEVKKQRQDSPSGGSAAGAAPSNSVSSEPGPRSPSSGSGSAKPSQQASSGVSHRILRALGSTTSVGPAKVPTLGVLMMGLIFVAGTALAAFIIYLSQTGPDPEAALKAPAPLGPDPMEVELQEMIANEMARQLLSDLELGEPSVSSR